MKARRQARAIEPTGAAAADVLAGLHALCFADAWDRSAFATLLASPGVFALTAVEPGGPPEPLGFILCRLAAGEGEILTFGVLPDRRGAGHGRALLAAALDRAEAAGARAMFLEVDSGNEAAIGLYRAAGFEQVGVRSGYYGQSGRGRDAVVMRRRGAENAEPSV